MSSDGSTVYLITGASRGMGLGLARTFLARPQTTVVAAVRDPSTASANLDALSAGAGSKLITVKLDSTVETDPARAIQELQTQHDISRLDVVVANAGIAAIDGYGPIKDANPAVLRKHVEINSVGPKFLLIGSMQGSIGGMENYPAPMGVYGASKAMAHYLIRKIHRDHEKERFVVWAVDPGFVQTDTGNAGARFFGMEEALVKVDDAVEFITKQIDAATQESAGGKFPSYNGGEIAW